MTTHDTQQQALARLRHIAQHRKATLATVINARQTLADALITNHAAGRAEPDAIRAALAAGVKQGDIALALERSREHVRRLATKGV